MVAAAVAVLEAAAAVLEAVAAVLAVAVAVATTAAEEADAFCSGSISFAPLAFCGCCCGKLCRMTERRQIDCRYTRLWGS